MRLGKHVSIAGGIDKAPARAEKIGCNALQVFSSNPRGWKGRDISDEEARKVRKNCRNLGLEPLVVHSIYLINLASADKSTREKSVRALREDYFRTGQLGGDFLVFHPGSHGGQGLDAGVDLIAAALNQVLNSVDNQAVILLENVAGAGHTIGSNFNELNDIIKRIDEKQRVGICLDTCHAFAAGYDLSREKGLEEMLEEIDRGPGREYLKLIHINDSKHPADSNRDEHAHIGEGLIGEEAFARIINHPGLREIPFILETPQFKGTDRDVEKLLSLRID